MRISKYNINYNSQMNTLKDQVCINPAYISERVTGHGGNSHTLTAAQPALRVPHHGRWTSSCI